MKNHFLIPDSEKGRILNLHESSKPNHGTALLNESKESYKKGDKLVLSFDRKVLGIELTSDMMFNEPGNYSWEMKVTNPYSPELKNKTGELGAYTLSEDDTIREYTIFVYDGDDEILNKNLNPGQVKKI